MTRDKTLSIANISRHQYYYKPTKGRSGKRPSQTTKKLEGGRIVEEENSQVVDRIKTLKSNPNFNHGYKKIHVVLMLLGYFINHKKVYRLMKENCLLNKSCKQKEKNYAKYRIVSPEGPLQVLEMDIKYVWITQARRHAYILTVLDTFTRVVLHWQVGFSMRSPDIKRAWENVIVDHLQPNDMLKRKIDVEIRNDNGPQFSSKLIRDFFKQNYLDQVFTHPYTPQENGHIESFYSILSKALGNEVFWNLKELEARLTLFYEHYNNVRVHSSIAYLPPRLFWELWEKKLISRQIKKNNKVRFKLKIPYQQLSGNVNLREVPCLNSYLLDANKNLSDKVNGPESLQQPSVQRSPSVVPC